MTKAAQVLGIGTRTLYRKCEEYEIDQRLMRKKKFAEDLANGIEEELDEEADRDS